MSIEPPAIEPDTKDWTWVLGTPCPECGFNAGAVTPSDLPCLVRRAAAAFGAALQRPAARVRPRPGVWSVLEYGCHVRDVCRVFDQRLAAMLDQDDPLFPNWDQDATAIASRYWVHQPAAIAAELVEAAEAIARRFETVDGEHWSRPGRRSNGSVFTVESLARYFLHDLIHHAHDIDA